MSELRYLVEHQTHYQYDSVVTQSQQLLHLVPRETPFQQCLSHVLQCDPHPSEQAHRTDFFGNHNDYLTILAPHQQLKVTSRFEVACQARPTLDAYQQSPAWEEVAWMMQHQASRHTDASRFLYACAKIKPNEALAQFARERICANQPILLAAMALTRHMFNTFKFDAQATDVSTPLDEVLRGKRGVCQDFAHLMIGALRSLGLPCRYVSGYILTHPPAGKPRMVGADASHAWVSVYCPVYGWVDFDPTNDCLVQQEHITVAWGRDFSDVSPMRGVVLGGGQQHLKVSVTVTPASAHVI